MLTREENIAYAEKASYKDEYFVTITFVSMYEANWHHNYFKTFPTMKQAKKVAAYINTHSEEQGFDMQYWIEL